MVHSVSFILLIVGGLNWLLVGAFDVNVVEKVFGMGTYSTIVYVLVGLAALYELLTHKGNCSMCRV